MEILSKTAFWDTCLSRSNVFIWLNKFQNRFEPVHNDPRSGKPPTSITNENIVKIRNLMRSGRRLTVREMVDELNSSFLAVQSHLLKI